MSSDSIVSDQSYTHIVVGAGSAGCAIAGRLAANPNFKILLIEAGPDYPTKDSLPKDLVNAAVPSQLAHDWGIKATGTGKRTLGMIRGKVVGGSSAVNACIAFRAEPTDFDEWHGSGNVDWSWRSVLPYFKKLERDLDFPNSEYHGTSGPIPVRRWTQEELYPLSAAMQEACNEAGFPATEDHNAPHSTGYGSIPMNAIDGRRISAAEAYLEPVRGQDNFTIVSGQLVDRVLFEGNKATGIATVDLEGNLTNYRGETIVLSAGAFGSPAILQRSGIGAKSNLEQLNIPVIVDLPGVGANLSDHSQVPIGIISQNDYPEISNPPGNQVILKYASQGSQHVNDMQICLLNQVEVNVYAPYLADEAKDKKVFFMTSNLMLPESRGRVFITSTEPTDNPAVELDFCSSESDMKRHRDGLRQVLTLLKSEAFSDITERILETDMFADDATLDSFIVDRIQTAHHPMGTTKMGLQDDPTAVVDASCAVFGTESLFVADASIIPVPIRANTNLTCIMIGEYVADLLAKA